MISYSKRWTVLLCTLAIGAGLLSGCVLRRPAKTELIEATATPVPTMTATNTPQPTSTATPAATETPAPSATPDPHLIVITEDDITKAVAAGAGSQQGATVQNLKVRFKDGKTHITADSVGYGLFQVRNLDLIGHLEANNGVLSLAVESISPGGLAAGIIPSIVNQALAQYASQWYVEEVHTLDGRLELRIR